MNKKLLFLLLSISAISLCGCDSFNSSTSIPTPPISKSELLDSTNDLTTYSIYLTDSMPTKGGKLLVIPVWFTDSDLFIANKITTHSNIRSAFFGTNEETGWRSVKSYYEEESFGQFSLSGSVLDDWYYVDHPSSYYNSTERTIDLVKEAVSYFQSTVSENEFATYDSDKNGFLDGVALIYGADYKTPSSTNDNLWAYTYWIQEQNTYDFPIANTFLWASYNFMNSNTNHCKIDTHTYIHEFGHMLGLEDYYDYNADVRYNPAGGFSMQDYNVGMHDAYSLCALGWSKPYIPKDNLTITIRPFAESGDVILLANHNVVSPFDEYILLELYTPTGLNEMDTKYQYSSGSPYGVNKSGIRIWHVDARLISPVSVIGYKPVFNETTIARQINRSTKTGYVQLETNSSYTKDFEQSSKEYLPKLNGKYYQYKLLELIKANDKNREHKFSFFSSNDLFQANSTFSLEEYSSFFVNRSYMNDTLDGNKNLGWKVKIDSLSSQAATITITK